MIIPSLDLIDGNVVRLYQGNYKQRYDYSNNPLLCLKNYESQGANILHLVDLTGALAPEKRQNILLKTLLKAAKVPVQVGGGVRNRDDINSLLMAGATRVVIGSSAIQQPEETKNWFLEFGVEAIVLGLDIRIHANNCKKIAISGWNETVDFTLEEVISWYQPLGIKHILCTDISCDGTLTGTNIALYKQISKKYPDIAFQASGGIGSLKDISALRGSGIQSIIIGRALLEGKFTVLEAIKCWQNE